MGNNSATLVADAELTPIADRKGHVVVICSPPWFDERRKYRIANAPLRTSSLDFDGADLNYLARVLYAEASGSLQLPDKKERDMEKSAIMNVNHFRLNRKAILVKTTLPRPFVKYAMRLGSSNRFLPVQQNSRQLKNRRLRVCVNGSVPI